MRMGPGKHLKGLELMGGIVKPEEVRTPSIIVLFNMLKDPFRSTIISTRYVFTVMHLRREEINIRPQMIITQEFARCGKRGYGDGE